MAGGEDEELDPTESPASEHPDPVDESVMPAPAIEAIERMQQQIAAAASSPAIEAIERMQQQMAMPTTQLAETVVRLQQQMAAPSSQFLEAVARLQQMIAPSSQFLEAVTRMQQTVMPAGFGLNAATRDSMRRVSEMMLARTQSSPDDVLARIEDLIRSGVLDSEFLEQADQQLVADHELNTAVDAAATEIARHNPLISRKMARKLVVLWVYLVWAAGILSLVLLPTPSVILAILNAAGLGSPFVAKSAGTGFDKLFPPQDNGPPADQA